jgi:rare lipoprotein A
VTTQEFAPPPVPGKEEARRIMATIKPPPEVRQMPVTGPHQIYVQAGAFTKQDNAARLQRRLAQIGRVSVLNVVIKGVEYYRVRLGPVDDVAGADTLLKKVVQTGITEARIVVD